MDSSVARSLVVTPMEALVAEECGEKPKHDDCPLLVVGKIKVSRQIAGSMFIARRTNLFLDRPASGQRPLRKASASLPRGVPL